MGVAQTELGMDLADAKADTVQILREKIRTARASKNSSDPLAKLPKGLAKMSLKELRKNVHERDLALSTDHTRVQLEMQIRNDVSRRMRRIMRSTPKISQMVDAECAIDWDECDWQRAQEMRDEFEDDEDDEVEVVAVDMDFEVLEEEPK